jgi:preprotein translocase subunit SecE
MTSESALQRIGQWPVRLKNYVEELQTEMRRVSWPSAKQVRSTTLVVLATVFAFAGYFAVVDLILGRLITKIFDAFVK